MEMPTCCSAGGGSPLSHQDFLLSSSKLRLRLSPDSSTDTTGAAHFCCISTVALTSAVPTSAQQVVLSSARPRPILGAGISCYGARTRSRPPPKSDNLSSLA